MQTSGNHERLQGPEGLLSVVGIAGAHASAGDDVQSPLERIAVALERLAEHFAPSPSDIVGTGYIADKLGCTQVWVARMAADGTIPKRCILEGTGGGKVWKFNRRNVDAWLATRNGHLPSR